MDDQRLKDFLIYLAKKYGVKDKNPEPEMEDIKLYIIVEKMDQDDVIANMSSRITYLIYQEYCKRNGYEPTSRIHFSRFIVRWFDYAIVDKKMRINGKWKKGRLIVKTITSSEY